MRYTLAEFGIFFDALMALGLLKREIDGLEIPDFFRELSVQ